MKKLALLGIILFPSLAWAEEITPEMRAEFQREYQKTLYGKDFQPIAPEEITPEMKEEFQREYQKTLYSGELRPITPEEGAALLQRLRESGQITGPGQPDHRSPITLPSPRDPFKKEREIVWCGMNLGYFAPGAYYICYGALGSLFTCLASPGTCWAPVAGAAVSCGLSYYNVIGIIHNCM